MKTGATSARLPRMRVTAALDKMQLLRPGVEPEGLHFQELPGAGDGSGQGAPCMAGVRISFEGLAAPGLTAGEEKERRDKNHPDGSCFLPQGGPLMVNFDTYSFQL